jgi:putative transposase
MKPALPRRLSLQPGAWILVAGRRCCIHQVVDLETVLVTEAETGAMRRAKVRDLTPAEAIPEIFSAAESDDLAEIAEADWQRACERFAMIRPLLETPDCTRVLVHAQAESVGRHPATLYRWLQQYRRSGRLSTLVPAKRGVRSGHHRLAPDVEAVLSTTIDEVYLSPQKRSVSYTSHEVARHCRNAASRPGCPYHSQTHQGVVRQRETAWTRGG